MTARCPEGHDSEELDYCSVCGVAMGAAPAASVAGAPPIGGPVGNACPACGEPRADPEARYCEVCRYDFVQRVAGPPPRAAAAPATAAPTSTATSTWNLTLAIDPSLDTEPDPTSPPPKDEPERVFPIDVAEMLVGRRDERQNIRPAIPLNDPGASRRHAKFLLGADGDVSLQDLASMNGTKVNGKDVVSGSIAKLGDGDVVTLGRWTRIVLRKKG
jgi:hypothetical protein